MKLIKAIANKNVSKSFRITEKANDGFNLVKNQKFNVNESDLVTNFLEQIQIICKRVNIINELLGFTNNKTPETYIRVYYSKWSGYQVNDAGYQNAFCSLNIDSTLHIEKSNNQNQGYKYYACIYTGVQKYTLENRGFATQQVPSEDNNNNWYSVCEHFKTEEDLINFSSEIILNGYIEINNLLNENKEKLSNWK